MVSYHLPNTEMFESANEDGDVFVVRDEMRLQSLTVEADMYRIAFFSFLQNKAYQK